MREKTAIRKVSTAVRGHPHPRDAPTRHGTPRWHHSTDEVSQAMRRGKTAGPSRWLRVEIIAVGHERGQEPYLKKFEFPVSIHSEYVDIK